MIYYILNNRITLWLKLRIIGGIFINLNSGKLLSIDDNIQISRVSVEKPTEIHMHEFIEIAFVVSGEGVHVVEDIENKITKGDIFILNYGVTHQFSPQKGSDLIICNCIFKPGFFDYSLISSRSFSDITKHFLLRPFTLEKVEHFKSISLLDEQYEEIGNLFNKMYIEYSEKPEGYVEILRAYLIALLIKLFRVMRKNNQYPQKVSGEKQELLENVMKYIKNNYNKDLTLDELSMLAFLSPNHFCKKFKEYSGMTIKEFMQKTRIEKACSLLLETDKKIIEIAFEVGYHDLKHFYNIFKKYTEKTPLVFKKDKKRYP